MAAVKSKYLTIQQRLMDSFHKNADKIAIECDRKQLTYFELDQKSSIIATNLITTGIPMNTAIGVLLNDRVETIVAFIGILKAGCIFMPLDSVYPMNRLETMLSIAGSDLVIISNEMVSIAERFSKNYENIKTININNLITQDAKTTKTVLPDLPDGPEDMIYIYFTSGTTGKPKGILGKNKSLLHFVNWEIETFGIDAGYRVSQFTSPCHDPYLRDICVPLCAGGTVCIPGSRATLLETGHLIQWIEDSHINLIHCTPSLFKVFNTKSLLSSNFMCLKYILLGGERVIPQELVNWYSIFGDRIQLVNMYGPTETTLAKLFYWIQPSDAVLKNIPIGAPIKGAAAIIVNEELQACGQGESGEILIRTPYATYGYINDPETTSTKFIPNPFNNDPRDLVYKTGDLGRVFPNGNIEFLGRIDRQVKIRGYRVELNEIQYQLLNHPDIQSCVIDYKEEPGDPSNENSYIVAYYISDHDLDILELRSFMEQNLPDYMIPRYFVPIETIPLTPNGKIDYKALPLTQKEVLTRHFLAPRNPVELKLAEIWSEILNIHQVGIDEYFFHIGGHSLKLMTLVAKVYQEFKVELPVEFIFDKLTIEKAAAYILNHEKSMLPTINPVGAKDYYKVSPGQKRLYILNQFEGVTTSYNLPRVFIAEGNFEPDRVERVFQTLIQRHETLRTSFDFIDGIPVQKVHRQIDFKMEMIELQDTPEDDEEIKTIVRRFIHPFELDRAPLFRVGLIKLAGDKYIFMFDMHHIISDGISLGILVQDFIRLYNGEELPELAVQYKDFSEWQYELYDKGIIQKQEEYWLEQFKGEIPALNLPTDYARPAMQSFEGDNYLFEAGNALMNQLNTLAASMNGTLFMVILTAYNILLSKYSGQEDIIVGFPLAGRIYTELANIIGMFVNTIVLRNYPEQKKTVREFLIEVKENLIKAFENQNYQFEELVEKIDVRRDLSRNPIFDTMLTLQNFEETTLEIPELRFRPYEFNNKISKFDLSLYVIVDEEKLVFNFVYCTKLFTRETIERMAGHFINILHQISRIGSTLSEIDLLSGAEKDRILTTFNDSKAAYPKEKSLMALFEEQVEKTPEKIAIFAGSTCITYRELNQIANRLAGLLRAKGVTCDNIVGLMTERSPEMIIGIWGIFKASGAYLPINSNYPAQRIQYLLKDSGAVLLLTQRKFFDQESIPVEMVDIEDPQLSGFSDSNPKRDDNPHNLAYVIYTSGSTGQPKGVMIEQFSIVNRLHWMQKQYPLSGNDIILLKTTYTFDVSVWELLWWALEGAAVCVLKPDGEKDPEAIINTIAQFKITVLHFVPSMLQIFLEYLKDQDSLDRLSSLKQVFASGEKLTLQQVNNFRELLSSRYRTKLANLYGPTEATVDVSYFNCTEGEKPEKVPIGKPIDNINLYIVNDNNQLQPLGIPGELLISGDGLARGYLNRPELTAEKFIPNPFVDNVEDLPVEVDFSLFPFQFPLSRMYRTGDLARWLPDGNIEYIGRMDHQVKVRGFRIELAEIEAHLLKHEEVKEVVVVAKEEETSGGLNQFLCAYLVLNQEINPNEFRDYLSNRIPDFMIPSYFIRLDRIPLSTNGKIDQKALPKPDKSADGRTEYIAPRNEIEAGLVKIWEEILQVERVGITDDFFELGGHSLKAMSLLNRIHKEFNVRVPINDIFTFPIREIAEYIGKAERNIYTAIVPLSGREYYPASSAQKRFYLLSQFEGIIYNLPVIFKIKGDLDRNRLEQVFHTLIQRHEALRTSFEFVDDELVQHIHPAVDFKIEFFELPEMSPQEENLAVTKIIKDFIRPFDLDKAPLIRAGLIKLSGNGHIFLYDIHHIISDGVSMGILGQEFTLLYNGEDLPELRIQYKDFSEWQNQLLRSGAFNKQEEYWVKLFQGEIPLLNLPVDYPGTPDESFKGGMVNYEINQELTGNLQAIAEKTGTTLYMILLAVYNVLLLKYTNQDDFVVGTDIFGRPHDDLANTIGVFVNTLPMRNKVDRNLTFREFLMKIRENTLKAFENQDYQFADLVAKLNLKREAHRNPLFDTMLDVQNYNASPNDSIEGIEVSGFNYIIPNAKALFCINAYPAKQKIFLEFLYYANRFKHDTVERLAEDYLYLLESIVDNFDRKLAELELASCNHLISQGSNPELGKVQFNL